LEGSDATDADNYIADLLLGNSTDSDSETCTVSTIADPLGSYSWLNQPYSTAIYMAGMFYLFFGLGYVCEEFFITSIERIILIYQIPPDVAGATLMAAGSSAPELFASIVGCFLSKENGAGTGTVVGSAVFNQLVIIGGALILAPQPFVKLDIWPLIRDLGFCIIAYIEICVFTLDGEVKAYEAWTLFGSYMAYVLVNCFWSAIMNKLNKAGMNPSAPDVLIKKEAETNKDLRLFVDEGGINGSNDGSNSKFMNSHYNKTASELQVEEEEGDDTIRSLLSDNYVKESYDMRGSNMSRENSQDGRQAARIRSRYEQDGSFHWEEDELHAGLGGGRNSSINPAADEHVNSDHKSSKLIRCITFPLTFVLSCVLIDVKKHPKWFWLAFANSITVLGIIVYFLMQWVDKAGCLAGLSSALMGLTLGAAGTSTPDALVSFHVARNGMGDMAVSNALGSNVFDILLCLGLPMGISTSFLHKKVEIEEVSSPLH
jgi:K+-dependent Na+/Ca+ exchanger-like protein